MLGLSQPAANRIAEPVRAFSEGSRTQELFKNDAGEPSIRKKRMLGQHDVCRIFVRVAELAGQILREAVW